MKLSDLSLRTTPLGCFWQLTSATSGLIEDLVEALQAESVPQICACRGPPGEKGEPGLVGPKGDTGVKGGQGDYTGMYNNRYVRMYCVRTYALPR